MAAWAVVSGGFAIASAVRLRHDLGRWWMGFTGALSVVAGILLAIAPLIGAVVLTWWLGVYAIIFGTSLIMLAYRLRTQRHATMPGIAPHPA